MGSIALVVFLIATSTGNSYTPTLPGGIIAWIVCYRRRRQEIGGWLLFYYWQLYGGILLSLIFFFVGFHNYVPDFFADSATYHLFLASTVPVFALYALQIAVATIMVSMRTWDFVKLIRWVIIAELAAELVATGIDIKFFPDSLFFDFYNFLPSLCWLAYFFRSRRVIHVFKTHDWEISVGSIYPPKLNLAT